MKSYKHGQIQFFTDTHSMVNLSDESFSFMTRSIQNGKPVLKLVNDGKENSAMLKHTK